MNRGLIWTALVILGACGSQPLSFAGTDCGITTQNAGPDSDSQAVDCVWKAYSSGTAVQWKVKGQTIEGDPIPGTLRFDQVLGVVITRDMSADKFSSPANRRMWTWRCAKMVETPWATDPSRYFFELSACTGDGPTATFP